MIEVDNAIVQINKGKYQQVNMGVGFAQELDKELKTNGFKKRKCSFSNNKAMFESYLVNIKDGITVDILVTNFMGIFTEIDCCKS